MAVPKISLIIVDDHPLVRESLAMFMAKEEGIVVAAICPDADAGAEACRRMRPDVVLMDIEMPGTNAFQIVRTLRLEGIKARFVFLSAFLTDAYLEEAVALGDCGYLVKSADVGQIACAIRDVAAGMTYFSPEAESRLATSTARPTLGRLTTRELEVLRLVASDLSCKAIASKLGLSARTVDRHKANIMEKLGIHSQVGLTRYAVAQGICDPRQRS